MRNSNDGTVRAFVTDNAPKKRGFLKLSLISFLMLAFFAFFIFGTAFWAQGSTLVDQPISELLAYGDEGHDLEFLATEEVAQEDNGLFDSELLSEYIALHSEESTATVEEIEEFYELMATQGYIVPLSDAVAGLPPVPPGSVGIATMAELSTALGQANAGTVDAIHFTAPISGTLAANATNNISAAGLGNGLIIDGRGHTWNCGNADGTATIRVTGGVEQRRLSVKNIDFMSSGGTGTGDVPPAIAIATATGTGSSSAVRTADSFFWTVDLHNIRSVTSAGEPTPSVAGGQAANRGLINISEGVVNFSGTTHWTLGQRRTIVNARSITFDGGEHRMTLNRGGAGQPITTGQAARSHILVADPLVGNRDAVGSNGLRGANVNLINGAEVYLNRNVTGSDPVTDARQGYVMLIHSGGAAPGDARPATLNLSGGSNLTAIGNNQGPRGSGAQTHAGTVSVRGGSGGVYVLEGSTAYIHNVRTGNRLARSGTSALFLHVNGGGVTVDGEGASLTAINNGMRQTRQAPVRFYRGGQTLTVTNGAELHVERRNGSTPGGGGTAGPGSTGAAIRFGNRPDNSFVVGGGATVNIINEGNGTPIDPGTQRGRGHNAAVCFAGRGWSFDITGDSDMQLRADFGAAINGRALRDGSIFVGEGANFTAMGRTNRVRANDAIIRLTGGNATFHMDAPQFYDFVNTRPGGGRVFALGTAATNSFTSTRSDIAVWRRGINDWQGDPDRHWTLIDVFLSGPQMRNVGAASYPDFIAYYNTEPHSRRLENYTRISGNNSRPVLEEAMDLTNADRHVRALVEVPQGRIRDPRPAWTNEVWGNFTGTCAQTGATVTVTSNDVPVGALVRSFQNQTMYEVETNVRNEYGVLKMTHDDGRFLRAGDLYRVDAAWRATTPGLPRNHQAANLPPAFEFEPVRDVLPPMPVMIDDMIVPIYQTAFGGTWSLEDMFDDGPQIGAGNIRLYAQNGTDPVRSITGAGLVGADNTWTFTADADQLFAGDIVWVSLADTQDPPNWNPIQPTPKRDRMIPEASWFIVAADGTLPLIVQNFFNGAEYIPYRHIAQQMSFPNPGEIRTAQIGTGVSTEFHTYTPPRDRRGYMVESIELRGPGSAVQNIAFGADGRPLAPIEITPGWQTIHVHRVHDPEYTRDILVEFRFADFGGTNLNSLTLQVAVPYAQVRTGTYNQEGIDRFPGQALGDFHITETLTSAQILALVNPLFVGEYDPITGDQITPPAVGGIPRGFTPCRVEHVELPVQGPGAATPQLTFPVSMGDLYDARTPANERRPIIINFTATLEEIVLEQELIRCPEAVGTPAQLAIFDNMSFNYQVALHRGPIGGPTTAPGGGATPWTDHRLEVRIETERAEEHEETGALPAWAHYVTRTWHGGTTGTLGSIRIGTWNDSSDGTGDGGTGTVGAQTRRDRRIDPDDSVIISNVPSTAYVEVIQQINSGPAGTNAANADASAANQAWINSTIQNSHERDFEDSYTEQLYMWYPVAAQHLSTNSNVSHTTNWARPLPTDTYPNYNPARPMENLSRDFLFNLIPQRHFDLTVTNEVDGEGADMDRERYFSVQIRNAAGDYIEAGRILQLWLGEYEAIYVGTDPETGEPEYEDRRVLTPITVGTNGLVTTGLPPLAPGESFTLMRLRGMYDVRAVMLEFPSHDAYEVYNHFVREREAIASTPVAGMNSGVITLNRDNTEITFDSYRDWVIPTGVVVGSVSAFTALFVAALSTMAFVSRGKRKEIESVPPLIGLDSPGSSTGGKRGGMSLGGIPPLVPSSVMKVIRPAERAEKMIGSTRSFMRTILLRMLR